MTFLLDSGLDTIEVLEMGDGREKVRVGFKTRDGRDLWPALAMS
jgi:hypothetical protein